MSASNGTPPRKPNAEKKLGEAFENPLEKIEQLLTCSICLDRYKHPKLLPCQHTFCLACLDSYADTVHRNLKCPECRAEHALDPYEGAKAFPPNLTLAGFLDIHLQATDATAAEFQAYIETYNLERCKICDEKAQLQICAHCERKACAECRRNHAEMLKRDLARLLNQVKRLSNRIKEASAGLDKSLSLLMLNGESTRAEIRDYFYRYTEELRQREAHFTGEVNAFVEAERRVMSALRDALAVEVANVEDACAWTDAVLGGHRTATDAELSRVKSVFVDGVEYLRNFQPDSDELFGRKLRFSPGDDASKLPSAISNFGELTVLLPQLGNRYLPLEEQYLPKPFRLPLESDAYRANATTSDSADKYPFKYGSKSSAADDRYRRRQQLENEAWSRLRVEPPLRGTPESSSRCASPLVATNSGTISSISNSPWSRSALPSSTVSATPSAIPQQQQSKEQEHQNKEELIKQQLTQNSSKRPTSAQAGELRIDVSSAPAAQISPVVSPSRIPKSMSPLAKHFSPQNSVQSPSQSIMPSCAKISTAPPAKAKTNLSQSEVQSQKKLQKQNSKDQPKAKKLSTTSVPAPSAVAAKTAASQQQDAPPTAQNSNPSSSFSLSNITPAATAAAATATTAVKTTTASNQQTSAVTKNAEAEELPNEINHNNNRSSKTSALQVQEATAATQHDLRRATVAATILPHQNHHQQQQQEQLQRENNSANEESSNDSNSTNGYVTASTEVLDENNNKFQDCNNENENTIKNNDNNNSNNNNNNYSDNNNEDNYTNKNNNNNNDNKNNDEESSDNSNYSNNSNNNKKSYNNNKEQQCAENNNDGKHNNKSKSACHSQKPPLPRRSSSQDDRSLNEKVERIRADHEKINEKIDRIRVDHEQWAKNFASVTEDDAKQPEDELKNMRSSHSKSSSTLSVTSAASLSTRTSPSRRLDTEKSKHLKAVDKQKFRILYRSSSSRPVSREPLVDGGLKANNKEDKLDSQQKLAEEKRAGSKPLPPSPTTVNFQPITITYYPSNSCGEWPNSGVDVSAPSRRFSRSKTNPDFLHGLSDKSATPPMSDSPKSKYGGPSARVLQLLAHREMIAATANVIFSDNATTLCPEAPEIAAKTELVENLNGDAHESAPPNAERHSRWHIANATVNNSSKSAAVPAAKHFSRLKRRSSIVTSRELSVGSPAASGLVNCSRAHHRTQPIDVAQTLNNYAGKKRPKLIFGKRGDAPGEMNWPRGIAVLPGGEFAVCDSANHRVQIFDADGRQRRLFGGYGRADGRFDSCAAVAYHRQRKQLIVSDRYNNRVQIFDADGRFVRKFGAPGPAPGQFNNPWGVAVDELGLIYVVDKDNHRVQVFDRTGQFMNAFGRLGEALGQFNHPLFIAIHPQTQQLFISDSANHRVCVHAHDGTPLRAIGTEGFRSGELKLPRGLAIDNQGFVIVADSGNNRIQVFASDGHSVAAFGAWGTAHGQLKGVEGVALQFVPSGRGTGDGGARLICTDRENHRVQVF